MSGYTASLDTFGMTRHSMEFNSLAMVDGVLVGLDGQGAFALDGDDDDGQPIAGWLETGWTDFSEFNQDSGIDTAREKRLLAFNLTGQCSYNVIVGVRTAEADDYADVPMAAFSQDTEHPVPSRGAAPRGMRSRYWQFRLHGNGPWEAMDWSVEFDVLSRRR
jgi:hypothetical protein